MLKDEPHLLFDIYPKNTYVHVDTMEHSLKAVHTNLGELLLSRTLSRSVRKRDEDIAFILVAAAFSKGNPFIYDVFLAFSREWGLEKEVLACAGVDGTDVAAE